VTLAFPRIRLNLPVPGASCWARPLAWQLRLRQCNGLRTFTAYGIEVRTTAPAASGTDTSTGEAIVLSPGLARIRMTCSIGYVFDV
jgi:hypothetical protein